MTRRNSYALLVFCASLAAASGPLYAREAEHEVAKSEPAAEEKDAPRHLADESQVTQGSSNAGNQKFAYRAEAGVLVIHLKDPLDDDPPPPAADRSGSPPPLPPEASLSYVAYFKGDHEDAQRPITFLFNGGPGSSTVWLHMGAFGPKRVVTADDAHSRAAPYRLVDNEYSLLDASDLVFIDAPGTGFGHLRGADKEKAFWGNDPDAHAFERFIRRFPSRYGRWNSAKYLIGESYGTVRNAQVAAALQFVNLNGIVSLSQILDF